MSRNYYVSRKSTAIILTGSLFAILGGITGVYCETILQNNKRIGCQGNKIRNYFFGGMISGVLLSGYAMLIE